MPAAFFRLMRFRAAGMAGEHKAAARPPHFERELATPPGRFRDTYKASPASRFAPYAPGSFGFAKATTPSLTPMLYFRLYRTFP